jgi:aryl-alcohol dehydrogenase-like predicted oxidoreductase
MTFNGGKGFWKAIGTVDQVGADELIKACIDAGINFFDTADVYSEGESEKTLGQSLKNLNIPRKDVIIATKVFGRVGPGQRVEREAKRAPRRQAPNLQQQDRNLMGVSRGTR